VFVSTAENGWQACFFTKFRGSGVKSGTTLKNTAKISLLRPNVISFQGFPSEATHCSIRAFKHWKPSPKFFL